ncbi:MAG: hypothetical protein JXX28_14625, partial [Deltaproteobacteria bacterium]|nr:hypothetical protein [Deltaproteobacteria bacterium]
MTLLQRDGDVLIYGPWRAPVAGLELVEERFGTWRARGWAELRGLGLRLPMDEHYGQNRRTLREAAPEVRFASEWEAGAFPPAGWVPSGLALVFGVGLTAILAAVAAAWGGPWAGVGVVFAGVWGVARGRDRVTILPEGVRAGPAWAPTIGWERVRTVSIAPGVRRSSVLVEGEDFSAQAWVPTALLPALRGRLSRLGGLRAAGPPDGVDARYALWRLPALGVRWGALAGPVVFAVATDAPWRWIGMGLVLWSAQSLLQAAVEARATGWGAGSVLWLTALYALLVAAIGAAVSGG